MINVGVLGTPPFNPDVSSEEVAQAGGTKLFDLIGKEDRGEAMAVMTAGSAEVVAKYYDAGKFEGIISIPLIFRKKSNAQHWLLGSAKE